MFMSHLDSVCFNEYLKQLSKRFKNEKIVLIMDNTSFHKFKKLNILNNINIEYIYHIHQSLIYRKGGLRTLKSF